MIDSPNNCFASSSSSSSSLYASSSSSSSSSSIGLRTPEQWPVRDTFVIIEDDEEPYAHILDAGGESEVQSRWSELFEDAKRSFIELSAPPPLTLPAPSLEVESAGEEIGSSSELRAGSSKTTSRTASESDGPERRENEGENGGAPEQSADDDDLFTVDGNESQGFGDSATPTPPSGTPTNTSKTFLHTLNDTSSSLPLVPCSTSPLSASRRSRKRGRSPSLHLLWRSSVSEEAWLVMKHFYECKKGESWPEWGETPVGEWSLLLERAGL